MDEVFMEFYRGKDEQVFLDAWEAKHGKLSEEAIDDLYAAIADEIAEQLKAETHEIGDVFKYKGVAVGKSDYNAFYNLYIFEAE